MIPLRALALLNAYSLSIPAVDLLNLWRAESSKRSGEQDTQTPLLKKLRRSTLRRQKNVGIIGSLRVFINGLLLMVQGVR